MIRIRNWSSYQSYRDRRPSWIRLHRQLLDNYEYHSMSSHARALLPMLWLLASEATDPMSGLVEATNDKIAFRLRMSTKILTTSVMELEAAGFIEQIQSCIESVTKSSQNCHESVTPETETEKRREETEERVRRFTPPTPQQVSDYCRERGNSVNPDLFVAHYQANGWRVGRNPMRDWQAAVRTWERRDQPQKPKEPSSSYHAEAPRQEGERYASEMPAELLNLIAKIGN